MCESLSQKFSICELQVKRYMLKLDKVGIDCNAGEHLLLYTAQGYLVPIVLISHRHTSGCQLPEVTNKPRQTPISHHKKENQTYQ